GMANRLVFQRDAVQHLESSDSELPSQSISENDRRVDASGSARGKRSSSERRSNHHTKGSDDRQWWRDDARKYLRKPLRGCGRPDRTERESNQHRPQRVYQDQSSNGDGSGAQRKPDPAFRNALAYRKLRRAVNSNAGK